MAKGATTALYKVKKIKWRLFTSFEEVTRIPWVNTMEKEIIPKRDTTVGCNGPTKRNVTLEGMVKDIKQNL